ncbi:hypothetical protein NHU_04071 [Rhodovulum sulfidophilum]|uniref:Uncharacterized protein n=1 Tax=Rhodovulum sulfidophilum TaxID=35806 RepID=A0A0D6B8X3_RHOSU|nr:hypothetical protein [Rhodovulum sulfidophilum]BAQ71194.1 hypothetical protein NHU_04071 [Rhodovulum sulfidophilum]
MFAILSDMLLLASRQEHRINHRLPDRPVVPEVHLPRRPAPRRLR